VYFASGLLKIVWGELLLALCNNQERNIFHIAKHRYAEIHILGYCRRGVVVRQLVCAKKAFYGAVKMLSALLVTFLRKSIQTKQKASTIMRHRKDF
jgi:hypothetical protein